MVYTFSFDALFAGRPWGEENSWFKAKITPPLQKACQRCLSACQNRSPFAPWKAIVPPLKSELEGLH